MTSFKSEIIMGVLTNNLIRKLERENSAKSLFFLTQLYYNTGRAVVGKRQIGSWTVTCHIHILYLLSYVSLLPDLYTN
jgi:hypothetical protein